jgi:hypothetical protein
MYSPDNLLAKVKNQLFSLVATFLNDILKVLSIEEEFKKNIKNNDFSETDNENYIKSIKKCINKNYITKK